MELKEYVVGKEVDCLRKGMDRLEDGLKMVEGGQQKKFNGMDRGIEKVKKECGYVCEVVGQ